MQARASFGSEEIVEGTGQPCRKSKLAGASEGSDRCGSTREPEGNGKIASSREHTDLSSESVHTANRNFYHSGQLMSPVS